MKTNSQQIVSARDLRRQYGPGRGVCGVSLDVAPGECFALLGRNGSGKTTLTRLLLALERPDSGSLTVCGESVSGGGRAHLWKVGAVLDKSVHYEVLSGWQNAWFVGRAFAVSGDELPGRLRALFDLAELTPRAHDPVGEYSYGMRRKLNFVEALCHEPDLLVLDEPTAGVDVQFLLALTQLVRTRSDAGRTTWVSSNDPDWVAGVATRVGFIDDGRIIAEGTVDELVAEVSPLREVRVRIAGTVPVAVPELEGMRSFSQTGAEIRALLEKDGLLVPRLVESIVSAGADVLSVEVLQSSLRDAFLLKTGKALDE